jgi:membrane-bound serine protease (ClpP class)
MIKAVPILILGLLTILSGAVAAQTNGPTVAVMNVDGTINPIVVEYLKRGIEQAEQEATEALILQMDTPGGLDTSMREIVQLIDGATVPVIVYVPPGARAASAGFFITIASDVAAMAPDTAIGAATPISLSTEGEAQTSEELQTKIINDAVAYAQAIAESHGRNVEWAEEAVREGASIPASRALELGVIDLIVSDLDDLISRLDGWQVTRLDGTTITIQTQGADTNDIDMTLIESFLFAISDPNIAYILLSLAILGITVEIFNPGLIFPGVTGAVAGLLSFYSLGMLPVNLAGILLIVLAFGLFIAEAFTAAFGLLTAGGITALVVGSLILFKGGPLFQVDPVLIAVVAVIFAGLLAFVVNRIVVAHRRQAATGREEALGKTATVRTALEPEGTVFHEGEIWKAVLDDGQAQPGEEVVITRVDGLKLFVTKNKQGGD